MKIFTQICCVKLRVLIAAEQMEDDVIPTMTVKNELFKEKQSTKKKKEKFLQSFTHRAAESLDGSYSTLWFEGWLFTGLCRFFTASC